VTWADLPPLNTLVPFEAAVRLGSVTRAARELHVTHGAVSRQLQILERAVGAELFRRAGRSIEVTDAGLALARAAADALELLSAAARQARPRDEHAPFVLSCEPTLLMRWLIAWLPALDSSVSVHLSAGGGPIDLRREGVDAAIRRNDFPAPDGVAVHPIFPEWIGPVCRPDLAASMDRAGDIAQRPRLVSATRPEAWETWAALRGQPLPDSQILTFEHFYLTLEAAAAGLGAAIGPYALVKSDLDSGRLVAPFSFVRDGSQYVFLAANDRDQRTSVVRRWLDGHANDSVPPPASNRVPPFSNYSGHRYG
jgi:LysR family transcriptional regulator, glycine cleavage system transcriptional activator